MGLVFDCVRLLFEGDAEVDVMNQPAAKSLWVGRRFGAW